MTFKKGSECFWQSNRESRWSADSGMLTSGSLGETGVGRGYAGAVKDGDDGKEPAGKKGIVFKNEDGGWEAKNEGQKVKGAELRSQLMAELTTCLVAVKILSCPCHLSVEGLS